MSACDRIAAMLDDRIDGALDARSTAEVDAHLDSCPRCRAEDASIRAVVDRAARLPSDVPPRRDLWPDIRARIDSAGQVRVSSLRRTRWWAWSATAAALALAAALVVALADRPPEPFRLASDTPADSSRSPAQAVLASFDEAEADYRVSRDRFLAELERRSDDLDPETVRLVTDHLDQMEHAAEQIRAALESEPVDVGLRRMWQASYRKRLDLMRAVGVMPAVVTHEEAGI